MRQVWITKVGPPEVLAIKEAPDPQPAAGEMCIRVEASGVNFADVMGRLGLYLPRIPCVPGYEIAGRVDAVGGGVDASWIRRDVFALTRFGGYADVTCAPQAQVFPRPPGMCAEDGASIPVNYLTAWQLIVVMGGLNAGERSSFTPPAAASVLQRPRSPSTSGQRSSERRRPPSTASSWGRSFDRLQDRGLREAGASDHGRTRGATGPGPGRRRLAQERLS